MKQPKIYGIYDLWLPSDFPFSQSIECSKIIPVIFARLSGDKSHLCRERLSCTDIVEKKAVPAIGGFLSHEGTPKSS